MSKNNSLITDFFLLTISNNLKLEKEVIDKITKIMLLTNNLPYNAFEAEKLMYCCKLLNINWDNTFGKYIMINND